MLRLKLVSILDQIPLLELKSFTDSIVPYYFHS